MGHRPASSFLLLSTSWLVAHSIQFEPAFLGDKEAVGEHPYLRRQGSCDEHRLHHTSTDTVPNVLHQIWWQGKADIPGQFDTLRNTWVHHHPEWQHRLWDEASIQALVRSEQYKWFAPTFNALPSNIQKADAARYLILHAEGGVYADLDVEAFQALDDVVNDEQTRAAILLFEEPATHWEAHGTVISNGLIASPAGHPFLMRMLKSIKPVAEVFKSTGSHMLQASLEGCYAAQLRKSDPGKDLEGGADLPPCGCYVTKSAQHFFPLHEGMRRAREFSRVGEHADSARVFISDLKAGSWPPKGAYTAQYWTTSWIDPEIGLLFLNAVAAAREGNEDRAESLLLASLWSKWGTRYKYQNQPSPPDSTKAESAFIRALSYEPEYAFAHYELGNIKLEQASTLTEDEDERAIMYSKAEEHFSAAVALRPASLLFVNNLGVAELNGGKPEAALVSFRKVLELHSESFTTIQGLDPEAGAHLNIGHALYMLNQTDEAYPHWLTALEQGSYEYALQAAQRLRIGNRTDLIPQDGQLELLLGDALLRAGRSREAAVSFARAYRAAPATEKADGKDFDVRSQVRDRMNSLADVWDESGRSAMPAPRRKAKSDRQSDEGVPPVVIEAQADGSTRKATLTPDLIKQFQQDVKGGQRN